MEMNKTSREEYLMEKYNYNDCQERQIYRLLYHENSVSDIHIPNKYRFDSVADWKQYVIDNWITKEPAFITEFYEQMSFEKRKQDSSALFLSYDKDVNWGCKIDSMFYQDYLRILRDVINCTSIDYE